MARAFVALGSNLNPAEHLREALHRLARAVRIVALSTVYRTAPLERPEQPSYLNCVVEIETNTPPAELKRGVLRRIEAELGRRRTADKFAARTIDLDLIAYDDLVQQADDLTLPDPEILRRPFLALPLAELAPRLVLPGAASRLEAAVGAMPRDAMAAQNDFTALLRRELRLGCEVPG